MRVRGWGWWGVVCVCGGVEGVEGEWWRRGSRVVDAVKNQADVQSTF